MCDLEFPNWNELKSTIAAEMLSGNFPKCGIKYTGKYSAGLVIAASHASFEAIVSKAKAANPERSYVFMMPDNIARVYGHDIPVLLDVVA